MFKDKEDCYAEPSSRHLQILSGENDGNTSSEHCLKSLARSNPSPQMDISIV